MIFGYFRRKTPVRTSPPLCSHECFCTASRPRIDHTSIRRRGQGCICESVPSRSHIGPSPRGVLAISVARMPSCIPLHRLIARLSYQGNFQMVVAGQTFSWIVLEHLGYRKSHCISAYDFGPSAVMFFF